MVVVVSVSRWRSRRRSNDSSGSSGSSDSSSSTSSGRRNNSKVLVGERQMRRILPKTYGTNYSSL